MDDEEPYTGSGMVVPGPVAVGSASQKDVVTVLRIGYLSSAILIVSLYYIAPLRTRFLSYGVRDNLNKSKDKSSSISTAKSSGRQAQLDTFTNEAFAPLTPLLDRAQQWRVPHSWFKHFYVVAVPLSLFWLVQISTYGPAFEWLALRTKQPSDGSYSRAHGLVRVLVLWTLFFCHLCRRLYESFAFEKKSKSTMWVGHWVMGLLHYLAMSVALWIEAVPEINTRFSDGWFSFPSLTLAVQLVLVVPLFFSLNVSQHRIHGYLYNLPSGSKVNMPAQGIFKHSISPHYGSEVGIYMCLFALGSSSLFEPNWTLLSVLCFVICNLSISAQVTKDKYGEAAQGKTLLGLPGLCRSDLQPLLG